MGFSSSLLMSLQEKAQEFGVKLGDLRVVHVDDEPDELQEAQRILSPWVATITGFQDPRKAVPYIVANHGSIDCVLFDQFLTSDLRRIVGFQGTDVVRRLHTEGLAIPALFYSGSHARIDCIDILRAINATTGVERLYDEVIKLL